MRFASDFIVPYHLFHLVHHQFPNNLKSKVMAVRPQDTKASFSILLESLNFAVSIEK